MDINYILALAVLVGVCCGTDEFMPSASGVDLAAENAEYLVCVNFVFFYFSVCLFVC